MSKPREFGASSSSRRATFRSRSNTLAINNSRRTAAGAEAYFSGSFLMADGYLMVQMDIKHLQHRDWAIPFM